jgi:hypothetical protein
MAGRDVFSFHRRLRSNTLQSADPRDGGAGKNNKSAGGGSHFIFVTCPVCVRVAE